MNRPEAFSAKPDTPHYVLNDTFDYLTQILYANIVFLSVDMLP